MGERQSRITLQDILVDQHLTDELMSLEINEKDVTWGERFVVVCLRSDEEVRTAQSLQLNPIGDLVTFIRTDRDGKTIDSDEDIKKVIRIIKGKKSE